MRSPTHSRPRLAIHALYLIAASALAIMPGCGGGASPADASVAEGSTASAEVTSAAVPKAEGGSVSASLDEAVASYDRVTTPAGGDEPLTAADIAAAQAAFDKVGDDLSRL